MLHRYHKLRTTLITYHTHAQNLCMFLQVFFVDYGTVDEVDTQNIRFLKKDFVTLPAQAYRGVIDGIKPIQGIWMRDDTIYLQQQVLDRPLCGSVTHVNAQVSLWPTNWTATSTIFD